MKREEVYDIFETLFYVSICVAAVMVFIIPAIIFRIVQDRE